MGQAAAIAYGRKGADLAINYFLNKEPDAQEVIRWIEHKALKILVLPGDLATRLSIWSNASSTSSSLRIRARRSVPSQESPCCTGHRST